MVEQISLNKLFTASNFLCAGRILVESDFSGWLSLCLW